MTLAKDPSNTGIGLARDAASLKAKLDKAGLTTVHAVEGDVGNAASMKVRFEFPHKPKVHH